MMIFWDQRLAFLATPKTGSTALEAALKPFATLSADRPPVLKHTTVHRYFRFIGPYLAAASGEEFTTFALMREPRDWLGSWYRFRARPEGIEPTKSTRGISFDAFVAAWCEETPPDFAAVGAQSRFLAPRNGRGVDRLFRYEDMAAVTGFLSDRFGQQIVLPRSNVSPPGDLTLSPATERRLQRAASEDFALYESLGR
jgi:hypothetical protein